MFLLSLLRRFWTPDAIHNFHHYPEQEYPLKLLSCVAAPHLVHSVHWAQQVASSTNRREDWGAGTNRRTEYGSRDPWQLVLWELWSGVIQLVLNIVSVKTLYRNFNLYSETLNQEGMQHSLVTKCGS